MNAYLFAASVTRTQVRPTQCGCNQTFELEQTWGEIPGFIVCAANPDEAQQLFESCLRRQPEGQHPLATRIHKIVAAQLIGQLLTETTPAPLDWPQIARQALADMEASAEDVLGRGAWLDLQEVPRSCPGLEALRQKLPAATSSELNWSPDQQTYFVISVLTPPPPPPNLELPEEPGTRPPEVEPAFDEADDESATAPDEPEPIILPVADLEAAALIRARNAAVAVWLWHQYAAETNLTGNPIRLELWCGAVGFEADEVIPAE